MILQVSCTNIIMPIMFSIGVFIHRKFDSRELIDVLDNLGMSISYREVLNFERCSVLNPQPSINPSTYVQFVFDNADINLATLDGRNSFHALGGLMICTPKLNSNIDVPIQRLKLHAKIENLGSFGTIPITRFTPSQPRKVSLITPS